MLNYRIDILRPEETYIYSDIHDGTIIIDESSGGYKVYNGALMIDMIKDTVLELVKLYNNTPPDRREIMNGTRIVDHYKREDKNEL